MLATELLAQHAISRLLHRKGGGQSGGALSNVVVGYFATCTGNGRSERHGKTASQAPKPATRVSTCTFRSDGRILDVSIVCHACAPSLRKPRKRWSASACAIAVEIAGTLKCPLFGWTLATWQVLAKLLSEAQVPCESRQHQSRVNLAEQWCCRVLLCLPVHLAAFPRSWHLVAETLTHEGPAGATVAKLPGKARDLRLGELPSSPQRVSDILSCDEQRFIRLDRGNRRAALL